MNFIYCSDNETIDKLLALGFKRLKQEGDISVFVNEPSKSFELNTFSNKILMDNKLNF